MNSAALKDRFLDRVLLIDKHAGITSFDAVRSLKKASRIKKVGHCGSLDPGATGLLILCTGAATRISSFFMDLPKEYVARIRFGTATDTYDAEGKVVESRDHVELDQDRLQRTLPDFLGQIQQVPPMVSALRHQGQRLYDLARRGVTVERAARQVHVYELELLESGATYADLRVACGRGCYVRSLAVDIGRKLGLPAHLESLRRTAIGPFRVAKARGIEEAVEPKSEWQNDDWVLSVPQALHFFPDLKIRKAFTAQVLNGAQPQAQFLENLPEKSGTHRVMSSDGCELLALAEVTGKKHFALVRLQRVFPKPLRWIECEAETA